jgi:3-keto-5-aminohexanoate cleavage enzyme
VNWKTGEILLDHTYTNPFKDSIEMGQIMRSKQIKPEMECFTPSHIETVLWLNQYYKIFETPLHFGLVFGVCGAMQFSVHNLSHCLSLMPRDATWVGIGIGPNCYKICQTAIAAGGHVRVGLEDNVLLNYSTHDLSKGSWDQVEQAVEFARIVGRSPATPAEARAIFHVRAEA